MKYAIINQHQEILSRHHTLELAEKQHQKKLGLALRDLW